MSNDADLPTPDVADPTATTEPAPADQPETETVSTDTTSAEAPEPTDAFPADVAAEATPETEVEAALPEAAPAEAAADEPVPADDPAEAAATQTEAVAEGETAPAADGEAAAPAGPAAGVDPALVLARMTEVVEEFEAIAATPDADETGKHPDDRGLTERLRVLEETWRTLLTAGVHDADLRARQQVARAAYASARSRRAESRAVDRARSGETKRALLVEAFALSQLAQGTSLSQLAGRRVGEDVAASPKGRGAKAAATPATDEGAGAAAEADAAATPATDEPATPASLAAASAGDADAPTTDAATDADAAPATETEATPTPSGETTETTETAETAETTAGDATPGEAEAATDASPAADAAEAAEEAAAGTEASAEVDGAAAEPVEAVTAAETELSPEAEAAADAAVEPVDVTAADTEAPEAPATDTPAPADEAADGGVPSEEEAAAVAEGPTQPEEPVSTTTSTIDIIAIARRARELQNEWNAAGFAGKEVENELAPLFRRYMQVVFDLSRKESNEKADARRALVAAARELAEKAGEGVTGAQIAGLVRDAKKLQSDWKAGPAAPPAVESGAWRQFSGALRQVFVARDKVSGEAKEERERIIAAVEALAQVREPMRAMRDLGPLLRRWREAGPVPGQMFDQLKTRLDRAAATVRERADSERKRRDAEDAKSSAERSKNASKIIREAQRSGGGKRQERPREQAQAQGALAAALAEAFGRAERVADEVRDLEKSVAELRERLQRAEAGTLTAETEEVATSQGFSVKRQTIDPGSVNPERLRRELAQAEQALTRRQGELRELTSSARTLTS